MEKNLDITNPYITRTSSSVLTNQILQASNSKMCGKGPRYNEPLYNEDPGITNQILQASNSKMYGKEPRYNELPL